MADLSREEIFGTSEFLPTLVDELDEVFPQVTPQPTDDIAIIKFRAGQRHKVEFL